MAPRPPSAETRRKKKKSSLPTVNVPTEDFRLYLAQSSSSLHQGDAATAAKLAKKAHNLIRNTTAAPGAELTSLTLLAESYIELGDLDTARTHFLRAAQLDPDGTGNDPKITSPREPPDLLVGGGPETFLWLAQLSPEGGKDSVEWFEKGASALRRQIDILDCMPLPARTPERAARAAEKRQKLCQALCAVAEVYMTDLSWEADAEARCESLVTEATMVCPESAEAWQTLANVRISQARVEEARAALRRSLEVWNPSTPADGGVDGEEDEEEEDDENVPEFATRVSLARLLMEVEMLEEAVGVLDRMRQEDDQSIEVMYLGGWAHYLWGAKIRDAQKQQGEMGDKEEWHRHWRAARRWLTRCLILYKTTEYEDEQLGQHANELIEEISEVLGPMEAEEEEDDDEDVWEDAGDSDEEMT